MNDSHKLCQVQLFPPSDFSAFNLTGSYNQEFLTTLQMGMAAG